MTENEAQENFGRRMPVLNTAARTERSSSFDGWALTSSGDEDANTLQTTTEAQGLSAARRFNLVKNRESDSPLVQNLVVHVTDEELAGFRFACAEAARAELEVSNPLVGLKHYRAALHSFPFLPGLDALRDQLVVSARNAVAASLRSADETLRDRRTWKAARRALERADALIEAEDTLHMEFAARYTAIESVYSRVATLVLTGQHRLSEADEHALLRGLHDEMADDPESYWHLPGWRGLRERLDRLNASAYDKHQHDLSETRRQLVTDIHHAYNDVSASAFIERYVQNGNPPPFDESIAQLQLEEAETLLSRAYQRLHTCGVDASAFLHSEINKLEAWQRDLRALLSGLSIARHRATLGLREPEQLDVACYVLGVGGRKPTTQLHQVPQMFVGHPSLLTCKSYVEDCVSRRKSQERLVRDITLCFRFDAATAPEQITGHEADDLVHTLRSHLQAGTAYPIEIAWDKLREMQRREPDDACGLQKALVYHDSDDHNREVVSLPTITAVVQCKVHQIHILRDWLQTFTAGALRKKVDFPGVANWEQERKEIETLRDSGPSGLTEAQARSRVAKSGDGDGTVQGLWPLGRICTALSQDSMMAYLRHQLSKTDPDAVDVPLCAAAHAINQQRHELWLTHEQHLHECDRLANDIALRIEHYAAAWDEFEHSYRALMGMSSLRRRSIAESAEWQAFQRAAEQFCGICPTYRVFQAKLQDVQSRFKLQPECVDGRRA